MTPTPTPDGSPTDPLADPAATAARDPDLPQAPATTRNRVPIAECLKTVLAPWPEPRVLEIASGTGEHGLWFCREMPTLTWQPTDRQTDILAGIDRWRRLCPDLANRHHPPILLDAATVPWSDTGALTGVDAVFTANLTHISPWAATVGLVTGAAGVLAPGGLLLIYGPFHENGMATGPGNARFDESLRARDQSWGIRDRQAVLVLAEQAGFAHRETIAMPADNRLLVLSRR